MGSDNLLKRAREFATPRDKGHKSPEYYRGVFDSDFEFVKNQARGTHWQRLITSYESAIALLHQLADVLDEHKRALADIAHELHYSGDADQLVSAFREVWEGDAHYYQNLDPTPEILAQALLEAVNKLREERK